MSRKTLLAALLVLAMMVVSACGGSQPAEEPPAEPTTPAAETDSGDTGDTGSDTGDTGDTGGDTSGEADTGGEADSGDTGDTGGEADTGGDTGSAAESGDTGDTGGGEPTSSEPVDIAVTNSLEELDSYRAEINLAFDGTNAEGADESGDVRMVMETINETGDMYVEMEMTGGDMGDGMESFSMEMYQVGADAYMIMDMGGGEATCIKGPADAAGEDAPDIGDMVGDIENAVMVESGVDVNGITADHYTIEDVSSVFGDAEFEEGTVEVQNADVWIAQDGGYVVKMDVGASGESTDGSEGAFSLQFELMEINEVSEIVVPASCDNAMEMPETP